MVDKTQRETNAETSERPSMQPDREKPLNINDVDMRGFQPRGLGALPADFNHIETSTFDLVANKDGFITRDSLIQAAHNPDLNRIQKDDVQHMLRKFEVLSNEFDDKDGGKNGISREDVAKYNFPGEVNYIESSTIEKLGKASDGTITREALADGLRRRDLSAVERDDMEFLQRQYTNIKELSPDGVKKDLGISIADIAANNAKVDRYAAQDRR